MTRSNVFLVVLFFCLAVIVPTLRAHIAEFDEVWRKRAAEALNNTLTSYEPHPELITHQVNKAVLETLEVSLNSTRRQLGKKKYRGRCWATNPIDRCWRCNRNWAKNRKRLADCVLGFGRKAKGGRDGDYYVVTNDSDNVMNPIPGSLRHAVIQKRPLWIIFARDMIIRLQQELIMQGDKTIDARGAKVYISGGAGITIQFVRNVIIHGLHIQNIYQGSGGTIRDAEDHFGLRTHSDGDGISIFGSQDVWIDHVSMKKCYDGLIDVIQGSTGVTISNSHFTDHNEVMLFGAHDGYTLDQKMQVTVAFNHFGKRLIQRMPRCRYGFIHVVNNDYTHWEMYAIGGSSHPTIISQGNRFIAPDHIFKKEVTKRDYANQNTWKHWDWVSENDYFLNGAFFVKSGDPNWVRKHPAINDGLKPAAGTAVTLLTRFSGALNCRVGRAC